MKQSVSVTRLLSQLFVAGSSAIEQFEQAAHATTSKERDNHLRQGEENITRFSNGLFLMDTNQRRALDLEPDADCYSLDEDKRGEANEARRCLNALKKATEQRWLPQAFNRALGLARQAVGKLQPSR